MSDVFGVLLPICVDCAGALLALFCFRFLKETKTKVENKTVWTNSGEIRSKFYYLNTSA